MTKKARIAELERKVAELERKAREPIIIKVAPVIVPVAVPEPAPLWPWPPYPYEPCRRWRPYDYITTGDPVPQYHYTTAGDTAGPLNLGFPSVAGPEGTIISLIG
ncbi:hypothetical protein LCGC14_0500410 [marine sediment metagenome]|uniref:Uncharacterized protein n=1 Tax=marine sediment metagenome TaxID=412755 RepID=A0A0F9VCQ4_9ZZZZ